MHQVPINAAQLGICACTPAASTHRRPSSGGPIHAPRGQQPARSAACWGASSVACCRGARHGDAHRQQPALVRPVAAPCRSSSAGFTALRLCCCTVPRRSFAPSSRFHRASTCRAGCTAALTRRMASLRAPWSTGGPSRRSKPLLRRACVRALGARCQVVCITANGRRGGCAACTAARRAAQCVTSLQPPCGSPGRKPGRASHNTPCFTCGAHRWSLAPPGTFFEPLGTPTDCTARETPAVDIGSVYGKHMPDLATQPLPHPRRRLLRRILLAACRSDGGRPAA